MRAAPLTAVIVTRSGRRYHRWSDGTVLPVVSGAADDTPPEAEAPEDLTEVPEDELRSRFDALQAEYDERRPTATREQVEELRALREQQKRINAELSKRAAETAATMEQLEALDADAVTLPEPGDPVAQAEAIVNAEDEAAQRERQPQPASVAPVTASAAEVAAARTPGSAATLPAPAAPAHTLRMVASASQQVVAPGAEVTSADLGRMFQRALSHRQAGLDGVNEQILAVVPGVDLDADALDRSNVARNDELIAETLAARRAARAGESLTPRRAAICGPLDIIRDIPGGQDTDEVLSGIFPSRAAGRLGYQYTPAAHLTMVDGSVVEWSADEQALVDEADPTTWKPCVDVECPTSVAVTMVETVGCVRVEESIQLSAPERVDEFMRLVRVQAARHKTEQLLSVIKAASMQYDGDATPIFGAYTTAVDALMRVIARAGYDDRLSENGQPYTLIVGPGFGEQLTLDRLARGFNPSDCETMAEVLSCLQRSTGIDRVVDLNDVVAGAAHPWGGALPTTPGAKGDLWDLPTTFAVGVVPTESFLYSTTGEAETGLVSDPQLVRQNRRQWFFREWWSLARTGVAPSFWLTLVLCGNGARAALVEGPTCPPASP